MDSFMRASWGWSSGLWIGMLAAQLPARYVLKADGLGFVWREFRLWGEYRLFRWAPPFIASVDRHRWDGLTLCVGLGYFRRWPLRGGLGRVGLRYYPLRRPYAPEGLWVGLHVVGAGWGVRRESTMLSVAPSLSIGYQFIFRQSYGGVIEPLVCIEPHWRQDSPFSLVQLGVNVGWASRRWSRRNLP
ncbi:MAG: hypothetical protein N3E49_01220 [Bacteroidia bacterium]|nr:hypothetical protein [Bacteroidia bacterium]